MQTCPNCQTKCLDDGNYCHQCRARLPNAKEWMPDFRNIKAASDINPDELTKLLQVCFRDEMFREHLLNTLITEAVGSMQSLDEKKRHMGKETLVIMFGEAMRYAGYDAGKTSDDGEE